MLSFFLDFHLFFMMSFLLLANSGQLFVTLLPISMCVATCVPIVSNCLSYFCFMIIEFYRLCMACQAKLSGCLEYRLPAKVGVCIGEGMPQVSFLLVRDGHVTCVAGLYPRRGGQNQLHSLVFYLFIYLLQGSKL